MSFRQPSAKCGGSDSTHSVRLRFRATSASTTWARQAPAKLFLLTQSRSCRRSYVNPRQWCFAWGAPRGQRNTDFALAQCVKGWDDYFLIDELIFGGVPVEPFVPPVSMRHLLPFLLLPAFSETSFVNLAIASGVLAHALGIDQGDLPHAPATGQSTFSFDVIPHPDLGVKWAHSQGQVEIDAVVTARRNGSECLFVVEAKSGLANESLAKHKLVYPVMALQTRVPGYLPVVPVYLKAHRDAQVSAR